METTFELLQYALSRPVQTAALAVFLYQTVVVVLADRRRQRADRVATGSHEAGLPARRVAA